MNTNVQNENKNRLCSKTCGEDMNTESEKILKKREKSNRMVPKEKKIELFLNSNFKAYGVI